MENGIAKKELQIELAKWLLRSEIFWRQKSRELWLKHGDKNYKFFHLSTTIQRQQNNIDALKAEDGTWISEASHIRQMFHNEFKSLFHGEEVNFPSHLENLITPSITLQENNILSNIPTPEQIRNTLFQMKDHKSPGPDGFPVLFYKHFWHIVGDTVISAVTSFFKEGRMPKEVNSSLITLIPKTQHPSSVKSFRPISLCDVV